MQSLRGFAGLWLIIVHSAYKYDHNCNINHPSFKRKAVCFGPVELENHVWSMGGAVTPLNAHQSIVVF